MATADGSTGRPSRRHAHVCRICDATFGCKAELLEHEQENHLRSQSKTIKRKSGWVTSSEVIPPADETSVGYLESPTVRKATVPTAVKEIAVDHEEIYDGSTVSIVSKHSKRDKDDSNSSPSSKVSTKQSKPILVTDSKSAQLEVGGYRGVIKSRQQEEISSRMQGSGKRIPERGIVSKSTLRPYDKTKEIAVAHVSKSDKPVTGLNVVQTGKKLLHVASASEELETGKHLRHSSVDVMTLLGLKRKRNEDGKSLDGRMSNDVCGGTAHKVGFEISREKSGLSAEIKSGSLSELSRNNYMSINQQKTESNLKTEHTVSESSSPSSVNIQAVDAKTKNSEESHKSDAVGNHIPLNYLVVETGPASEMYIDSAECSNEVTVIETPSNKSTRKRVQVSPKVSPVCVTSMPPPVNNNPGATMKRMVALTVAPSTPRMVSVLLLNRDSKPCSSSESQSQSGNPTDCINEEYGASQNAFKSEEVILQETTRPLEISDSLLAKENFAAECCSSTSSFTPPVGKSSITVTGGKIIASVPGAASLPNATAIRTLTSVNIVSPLILNKSLLVQKSQSSDELESVAQTSQFENNDAVSDPSEQTEALDDELSEENAIEAIADYSSGNHPSVALEEDTPDMCKFCMKKFDDIEKHLMSDHVCKQCGKEFRQAANLRKHIRVSHENVRPHQCPICSKGFAFMSNLSAHLPVHFQSEPGEDKQFACSQCDRAFKHSASLRKHTKEEHIVGPKPHVCQHCNKSFVFKCALDCHMRKHSGFRPFTCATCGTGFKHMSNLQKHVKVLHPGPCKVCLDDTQQCEHVQAARAALKAKFTCAECNRSFDCAASLATHVRSHTGEKPETCHMCGRAFQHRSNLQKHMMKHIGRKPHACTICPRAFYARHNLIAHMRKHTGNSPHECKTCGKRFCTKNSLQVHMNLHANVRPFACDVCGRQFSQLGNLQKHMSVHTGERPHVCVECKRSFTDISALKRHHAAIHERDARYVCEICDKRFLHLSSVRSHRLLHTGIKPHKCDTCGKAFTHKSGWLRHVRLHERANGAGTIVGSNKEVVLKPGEYIVYLTE